LQYYRKRDGAVIVAGPSILSARWIMFKPMKVQNMTSEEEIKKVQELDWDTYFREYHSEESMSLSNCPKCNAILVRQSGQTEMTCYSCGEKVKV
jgi:hypothetical protein